MTKKGLQELAGTLNKKRAKKETSWNEPLEAPKPEPEKITRETVTVRLQTKYKKLLKIKSAELEKSQGEIMEAALDLFVTALQDFDEDGDFDQTVSAAKSHMLELELK